MPSLLTEQHQEILVKHRTQTAVLRDAHREITDLAGYEIFHRGALLDAQMSATNQLISAAQHIELGARQVRKAIQSLTREVFIAVTLDTTALQQDDEPARTARTTLILDTLDPTRAADEDDSTEHIRNLLAKLTSGRASLVIPSHYDGDYAVPQKEISIEPGREIYMNLGDDRSSGVFTCFYDGSMRHNSQLRPPHIFTLGNAALRNIKIS